MSVYVLYMTVHVRMNSFAVMYTACVEVHMQGACAPPNHVITCSDQLVGVYIASCVCICTHIIHNIYLCMHLNIFYIYICAAIIMWLLYKCMCWHAC